MNSQNAANRLDWDAFVRQYRVGDFVFGQVLAHAAGTAVVDLNGAEGRVALVAVTCYGDGTANLPSVGDCGEFRILDYDYQQRVVWVGDILSPQSRAMRLA